jgi:hypothetical protein
LSSPPSGQSAGPPSGPSPDAIAQSRSIWRSAWLQAASIVVAALIGAAAVYQFGPRQSTTTAPPALGVIISPSNDSTVGNPIPELSGRVSNLRPGEMVWTFNAPQSQGGAYYPNTGPCPVTGGVWTCHNIYLGPAATPQNPRLGNGNYVIWAVIVSDSDAFDIVTHLRCNPTPKNTCVQAYSTLPGTDIASPQSITVDRTH